MTLNASYKGQHTAKLLSPAVWGSFPVRQAACMVGGEYRIADFRDAASTAIATPDASVVSGDIRVSDSGAADVDIKRSLGDGTPVLDWTPADGEDLVVGPQIVFDMSAGRPWAFECRISDADASANSVFAGIVSLNGGGATTFDAYTAAYIQIDGGTLYQNRAHIGFQAAEAAAVYGVVKDRGTLDASLYQVDGNSTAIKSGGTMSAVATMADDTFVKLGLYSDGRIIRWFVDNSEVAALEMGSTELPSGDYDSSMVPVVALNSAGTTLMQIQWVACGYLV